MALVSVISINDADSQACVGCEEADNGRDAANQMLLMDIPISVWTDKTTYDHNDTITVYGKVVNVSGFPITLTVVSPLNSVVTITATDVDNDGSFETTLSTEGGLWKHDGTYTIKVNYGTSQKSNKVLVELTGNVDAIPQPEDDFDLQIIMGNQVYDLLDTATINFSIDGTSTPQNVALEISDPRGTSIISRSFMVDSEGVSFEFRIDENFKTGTYKVVVTTSDNGNTVTDTAYFKVKSQYNSFKITSVQVTDQQGNPSTLEKGEMGFIKVNLEATKSITTLVTVNLFDFDLTSVGIGSIKTTLSSGTSEIILSFMIPSDVAVGSANIYVNAFSDWPSNSGIPLTGEVSIVEDIQNNLDSQDTSKKSTIEESQIENVSIVPSENTEISEIQEKLDESEKINLENEYSPNEREWITSGPFQIDRSQYAIGEKIFLVIEGLNVNEKGQIAVMRPLNNTHYSVYLTIPFDGSVKSSFNYYIEPQISKARGICSVDDMMGKWAMVFRGTDYPNLDFEITKDVVSRTNIDPVC